MSEMNATPATEAASSETQDFLSSVGESEKRVRVSGKAVSDEVMLSTKDVNVYYGDRHALHNTSLDFHKGEITALIGPSGCGKSTFLRSLNLMNREIRGCRVEGEINYRGRNVEHQDRKHLRAAPFHWHGVSAAQSFPQVHSRQHHVCA